MRIPIVLVLACAFAVSNLAACADTEEPPDAAVDRGSADGTTDAGWPDVQQIEAFVAPDGFILGKAVVYAHTAGTLYKADPEMLTISVVGDFIFPPNTDKKRMTDIALDKKGRMIGVTSEGVYEVDPKTAECTLLAPSVGHYVGLSFVPDPEAIDRSEFLMGLAKNGDIFEINPKTGEASLRGDLGMDREITSEPIIAAGDIVAVHGYKTLATVVRPKPYETDFLAELLWDGKKWKTVIIGDTGLKGIWGLGFWNHEGKNKVFGFTTEGRFVLIDVRTGEATEQSRDATLEWWGAGVTTEAPAIL